MGRDEPEVSVARMSAEVRREQLIEAAIRVAAREGIAAATTRRIAAEAEANLATVHYCFASKQQLLREVLVSIINELPGAPPGSTPPHADVADVVRAELRALWAVVEQEPDKQQLTYELTQYALRTPGLEELARWQYEIYYGRAARRLERITEQAEVEWTVPKAALARMLLTAVDGLVLGWLVDRDSATARATLDAFADALGSLSRPRRTRTRSADSTPADPGGD